MAKTKEKFKAISFRRQGKSIKEIASILQLSKSTISSWCHDVVLTKEQINHLEEKKRQGGAKGRLMAAEKKRAARLKEESLLMKQGIQEIGKMAKRDLFIAGVAMYWAEGYTYDSYQVGFTNSDPKIILLMLRWFKEICKITNDRIVLAVRINAIHKRRISAIEEHWAELTRIPLCQFNKSILIKSKVKKIYPDTQNYYGTLRITIRSGTVLKRKIGGWIEGLSRIEGLK